MKKRRRRRANHRMTDYGATPRRRATISAFGAYSDFASSCPNLLLQIMKNIHCIFFA
jgi:hypothetical protein